MEGARGKTRRHRHCGAGRDDFMRKGWKETVGDGGAGYVPPYRLTALPLTL